MMKLQDVETETEKSRNESGVAGQVDHMKSLFSTISKMDTQSARGKGTKDRGQKGHQYPRSIMVGWPFFFFGLNKKARPLLQVL